MINIKVRISDLHFSKILKVNIILNLSDFIGVIGGKYYFCQNENCSLSNINPLCIFSSCSYNCKCD